MADKKNPAAALCGTGLPQLVISFGGEDHKQGSPKASESQGAWACVREMERRSHILTRDGLTMRGSDRFTALALASTYAVAARDAAMFGASA